MQTQKLNGTPTLQLSPQTRLGYVHLTVRDLERQVKFYTEVLKFHLHWQEGPEAALGTPDEVLLRLSENPEARRVQRSTGLYHFALLYPSRKELARVVARLFVMQYPNYPTDHGFSKTTYLDDPEGNNIELYVRSLEDARRLEIINGQFVAYHADGRVSDGRAPLDLDLLFSEMEKGEDPDQPLPQGTQIGHVHLYGRDVEASRDFYARILGFQEGLFSTSMRFGDVGLDDEQPHVVAFNAWKGSNLPPAPPDALGMSYFSIVLPNKQDLRYAHERILAAGLESEITPRGIWVYDPAHIKLLLTDQMLPLR